VWKCDHCELQGDLRTVCRGTLDREGSESLGGFGTSFVANKGIQKQFYTQAPNHDR
jgi:hypothetical protein